MVELPRSLALIAVRLNDDARTALIDLLGGQLQEQVADLVRRIDLETAELDAYQQQLLAGFDPPARGREEAVDEEGESGDDDGDATGLIAVLAMLCAIGPKANAGDLLLRLPLHLQGQILPKLLKTSPLSASAGLSPPHRDLIEALREAAGAREEWGIESACQILRAVGSTRQLRRLLATANEVDHEAVVVLQNHLFVFEDLLRLSDRDMQALLVQIDNQTLGQALLLTDKQVHDALLRNISARRRSLIAEEEDRLSESTMEEIETAQQRVMAMTRLLYVQGKITTYFGSVGRSGPSEGIYTEEVEEEEGEEVGERQEQDGEEENGEDEPPRNYRGLLVGLGAIFLSAVVVWSLVGLVATTGRESTSRPASAGKGDGGSAGSRVDMVAADGGHIEASGESSPSVLSARQLLPLQAVVEMPGQARIEATGQTEVVAVDEEGATFEMRVGKVRTMVFDEDFAMKTPVVKIRGAIRGTLFDTRVVLEATTTVEVIRGLVTVESLIQPGQRWKLSKNMRGVFDTAGNGLVDKSAEAGK